MGHNELRIRYEICSACATVPHYRTTCHEALQTAFGKKKRRLHNPLKSASTRNKNTYPHKNCGQDIATHQHRLAGNGLGTHQLHSHEHAPTGKPRTCENCSNNASITCLTRNMRCALLAMLNLKPFIGKKRPVTLTEFFATL